MKIYGLTGGMGSGKSVVSELLRILGIPVYDSDSRSKELCDTDTHLREGLIRLFGPEIYDAGHLNPPVLAGKIFGDAEALKSANELIHPVVIRDFMNWTREHRLCPVVVMESAILLEAGFASLFDKVVCVTAPEDIRIQRVCDRSGLTPDEVRRRILNQLPEQERIKMSDDIIVNDGIQAVLPQVRKIFSPENIEEKLPL